MKIKWNFGRPREKDKCLKQSNEFLCGCAVIFSSLAAKVYESTTVYHVDTFQVMNQPEDMV